MKVTPLNEWIPNSKAPLVIAGPCSAETEQGLLETAHQISQVDGVNIFRAGIWKPRTRPGSFEGVGEIGLKWLKKVKDQHSLMTTCEVANQKHVELALKHDVDILWIGARTCANPFSVQEIANALKGVDKPVMIKNPINADLALWIGALERFNMVGITKLVAIFRGFSSASNSKYRNLPIWKIPLELKSTFPDLPILCDPSHICGRRDLIKKICQRAIDADMDGFMIETHLSPDSALSDAQQQITPKTLKDILSSIVQRNSSCQDHQFEQQLERLRDNIDHIDNELMVALKMRMEIVKQIAQVKAINNVTALQKDRMEQLINHRIKSFQNLGLTAKYGKEIFDLIHEESVRIQSEIMNSHNNTNQEAKDVLNIQ